MRYSARLFTGIVLAVLFAASWALALPVIDQEQPVIDISVGGLGIGGASEEKVAQVVTAGMSGTLTEVRFPVACASGDLVLEIQGVTGGVPNGVVLSSQTVPGMSLPSFPTPDVVSFRSLVLTAPVPASAGSQFAVVLSSTGECGVFRGPIGDPYQGGNAFFDARPNAAGAWVCICDFQGARFDLPFQTLVEPAAGGVITGSVKDDSGPGIGNVRVLVYDEGGMSIISSALTDTSGNYSIGGLQTGTYKVCFDGSSNNYVNECYDNKPWNSWIDIYNATPVDLTYGQTTILNDALLTQGGSIAGIVMDSSGVGIGNVGVSVYDSLYMWVRTISTGPDGNYNVGGLQAGTYKVCFDANMTDYLSECYNDKAALDLTTATPVSVAAGQTTILNNAALTQGGVITGTMKNESNVGIENVWVTIFDTGGMPMPIPIPVRSAPTDSSGTFTIGGLQTGTFLVCFDGSSAGYIKECYDDKPWNAENDIANADPVSVAAGQTLILNDAMLVSGGTISGKVTSDGASGIQGVWVYVCHYDSMTGWCNYAGSVSTDPNGNYAVSGLSSGSYKVWLDTSMLIWLGSDYLNQWYNNKVNEASADIVTVAAPAATMVNAQLALGGRISGTVTNGTAGIPGVYLRLYDSNGMPLPPMGMGGTTDPDGTYSIGGLRTGDYKVCFDAVGTGYLGQCYFNRAYDPANADTVSVTASFTTSGIDAVLTMGGTIIGRVTDGASGLFNVNVVLYNALTGMWSGGAMTDWNGNYSIGSLATGDYKVYFSSMTPGYLGEWYLDKADMSTADVVAVTTGQTTLLSDAVLAQPGSITGSVKNGDGAGIANVTVTVFDLNAMPIPMPTPMPIRSAPTDMNGGYTITGLQAGTYRVCFDGSSSGYTNECYDDKPWNSWSDIANADPVTVILGQTTSLDEAILVRGGAITGVVKNESNVGIGMVTVTVYDLTGTWMRGTSTDPNGGYSVGGLQTGTYKVCFDGSMAGYGNEWYNNQAWMDPMNATPVSVTVGQTQVLEDVELAQLGAVSGSVKNSGSASIGNVWVTVYDVSMMMPMPVRSAMTDTTGVYTVIGLQAGTYAVCFDGLSFGYINECYDDQPWNSWADIISATSVTVTTGQTTNLNDAVLVPGGVIAGSVKNNSSMGIGMVTVNIYDTNSMLLRASSTDFSGNYAIGGLQGGNYKVCFDAGMAGYASECYDDQGWMDLANADLVSVVTGQTTTLRNAVLEQGGVIAGSVKNSGGARIGMVTVNVYDANNMWFRGTMTDWNGSYSIGGLPTGNYKVCFDAIMAPGYSSECYDDQAWMDLVHATLVSVTSGQTTTLRDAVLAQAGYFTVITSAGPGGSISPTSQSVLNGTPAPFTIIPDEGFEISSVSGCGGVWTDNNPYVTGPVTIDCTVTATFSRILDTVPDAFVFIDQTGVTLNTAVVSNPITVGGINAPATISVTGGDYSINGGSFTSAAGTVNSGDTVTVRVTSSGSSLATVGAVLTIGGVSDTFSVTTRAAYQFIGFLQPIMNDGSAIFKSGRTVAIKFQLTGEGGAFVTNASATLRVFKVANEILGSLNVDASGNATSDTSFRYDFASNQYIYNLSTSGLGTGTFVLRVELDDGSAHEVRISLR